VNNYASCDYKNAQLRLADIPDEQCFGANISAPATPSRGDKDIELRT
jgi:hypothetical protein